jgi:outer membrane immunogenic protein
LPRIHQQLGYVIFCGLQIQECAMSLRFALSSAGVTAIMISGAGAASAGGAVVPIIEAAPAPVSAIAPVMPWQGAYAGASLGYSFGSNDEVGLQASDDDGLLGRATDIVNVKIGGVTGAVHAGYRWQRNNWVFGPSLSIEGGSVDDSESGSFFPRRL